MTIRLGAHWTDAATSFAVWAPDATRIELCLYASDDPNQETGRHELTLAGDGIWSATVERIVPGTQYGFRAHGAFAPEKGHWFNPAKLLVDPYARALAGHVTWHPSVFGYQQGGRGETITIDTTDSAPMVPKSVVVDPAFDWQGIEPPRTAIEDTIIYEVHLKGLTQLHPAVPVEQRGTYAGAAHPAVIEHLQRIGITAIEFLPIHAHVDDGFLVERGLVNYWGYNTLGFFAPESAYGCGYAPGSDVAEFKEMVRAYHKAGIEVILDVVYNHTAEANHQGPTLSFRGLANDRYYRLMRDNKAHYLNITGTGNTVNVFTPEVTTLVLDSLRYWVTKMGIDGFRFDLAPVLGRTESDFSRDAPFFQAVAADPVLSGVKMIAEPWDLGEGGYQVGNFPDGWSEWNDKYRDNVRALWRSDDSKAGEFGFRKTGSADVYGSRRLGPFSSVNFVAAHDGMTTWDVISYHFKRNYANGDNNTDGSDHDVNQFVGPDGESNELAILAQRFQRQRNLLGTLILSLGVPMLLGGDEFGRTQHGNNNAYCQDSDISWLDWSFNDDQEALITFVQQCVALRKDEPVLGHPTFPNGTVGKPDSWYWFEESGVEMTEEHWHDPERRIFGILLDSQAGDYLAILINAGGDEIPFAIPAAIKGTGWNSTLLLSTAEQDDDALTAKPSSMSIYRLCAQNA